MDHCWSSSPVQAAVFVVAPARPGSVRQSPLAGLTSAPPGPPRHCAPAWPSQSSIRTVRSPATCAHRPETRSVPSPARVNVAPRPQPATVIGLPFTPSRPPSMRQRPPAEVTLPLRSAAGGGSSVGVVDAGPDDGGRTDGDRLLRTAPEADTDGDALAELLASALGEADVDAEVGGAADRAFGGRAASGLGSSVDGCAAVSSRSAITRAVTPPARANPSTSTSSRTARGRPAVRRRGGAGGSSGTAGWTRVSRSSGRSAVAGQVSSAPS